MSPILASFKSAGGYGFSLLPAALSGAYYALATVTVGAGGASSIEFYGIPAGYRHLQLRGLDMQSYANNDQGYTGMQFNTDTGSNYTRHQMSGSGSGSGGAYGAGSQTYATVGFSSLSSSNTQYHAANIIDIYDYANTSKYKLVKSLSGLDFNSSGYVGLFSAEWLSTSAIHSIKLNAANGNFKQHSTYTLYGVK